MPEIGATEVMVTAGYASVILAAAYIALSKLEIGNSVIAATLCGGFLGFTAVQIYSEGLLMFWTNHVANLTGVQVWWDLLIAVTIALFFIAPRARKVGMNVPLWTVAIITTASIGLLAMIARLFWLERQAAAAKA